MDEKTFPGRQTDEKTLYFTRSHPIAKYAFFVKSIFFSFILFLAFFFLADYKVDPFVNTVKRSLID